MAIICSAKGIEPLMPEYNKEVFMGMMTHTSEEALKQFRVYGVEVDSKKNEIEKVYKLALSMFSPPDAFYLFFRDASCALTTNSPFIKTVAAKEGEKPKIEDWEFKTDEIGLYASCGFFGLKKIYFTTSVIDVKKIKELLIKRTEKKVLTLNTIYV